MKRIILSISCTFWLFGLNANTLDNLNDETKAFQQCQHYVAESTKARPSDTIIDCKLMTRSVQEWLCLEQQHLKLDIPHDKAIARCFHPTPGLIPLKHQNKMAKNIKASTVCITAFNAFSKFYPGDDRLVLFAKQCPATEKSTLEWLCMNHFAEGGNSYNYAAGQCLPRKFLI